MHFTQNIMKLFINLNRTSSMICISIYVFGDLSVLDISLNILELYFYSIKLNMSNNYFITYSNVYG